MFAKWRKAKAYKSDEALKKSSQDMTHNNYEKDVKKFYVLNQKNAW